MLGLRYDLRVPDFAPTTPAQQFQACVEQAEWADRLGLDIVVLSEHHGSPDGYLPAPLTLAGVILGRTNRIGVNVAAALLPLNDPVRLAEQLAVLDLCAPGRVSVVAGIGYRPEEFEMADVDKRKRGALLEEYVGVLRQAWTGEPFEWRGRTVQVTPTPATPGGPMLMVGGGSEAAARRAARLQCGFFASVGTPSVGEAYDDECAKQGFQGFSSLPSGPQWVFVAEDPDKAWHQVGPHALHDVQMYESWREPGTTSAVMVQDAQSWEDVRASGVYRVVTPDECVAIANEHGSLLQHPLMGGIPPELAWESLELFERAVLPRLRPSNEGPEDEGEQ